MKKELKFIAGLMLSLSIITSCQTHEQKQNYIPPCPRISIPQDTSYVIQKVNYQHDYKIELVGYEAYCYYDPEWKHRKAVITPQFRVTSLRGDNDETDIDFKYFSNTIKGPPAYLGKKHYFGHVTIPLGMKQFAFSGGALERKIPNHHNEFEIFLGMSLNASERHYNSKNYEIEMSKEEY